MQEMCSGPKKGRKAAETTSGYSLIVYSITKIPGGLTAPPDPPPPAVPVFIFISKGMVFAVAVRWPPGKILHRKGDVGSLDDSRPVFYISPGILEGALGLS